MKELVGTRGSSLLKNNNFKFVFFKSARAVQHISISKEQEELLNVQKLTHRVHLTNLMYTVCIKVTEGCLVGY